MAVLADALTTATWALVGVTTWLALSTFVLSLMTVYGIGQLQTAVRELDESRRDRHIQVLADLGRRWDEGSVWEAREKLFSIPNDDMVDRVGKWFETRDPQYKEVPLFLRVPNFFEDLAIMMEAGQLDLDWVSRNMRSLVLATWEYWGAPIEKMRETEPTSYAEFERLVRLLEK